MQEQRNSRGIPENCLKSKHSRLSDLKKEAEHLYLYRRYLSKDNIPEYPRPELHVAHLKHDTVKGAVSGICMDQGFKDPHGGLRDPHKLSLVWWSLAVGPEELRSAETRLLKKIYPNRTEEQAAAQQSFLWKFATSLAFSEKSMFGSYRFTFPLEEVLKAYSEQFCSGKPPVMRVFKTSLYKQEVVYVVLVHSPANQERFSEFPLLPEDDPNAVCAYKDGRFIWRPEAMCETHSYELFHNSDENHVDALTVWHPQFYVWDNVAIALHVEDGQVLEFDSEDLRENLTFCEKAPFLDSVTFDSFKVARAFVEDLWPKSSPLEAEPSLQESFQEPKEEMKEDYQ